MPKMPESDAKEETAESIAEKKEQVFSIFSKMNKIRLKLTET